MGKFVFAVKEIIFFIYFYFLFLFLFLRPWFVLVLGFGFHRKGDEEKMTEVGDFVVLEDVIGEGALSEVRFGQDLNTGESVAVKVVEKLGISEQERKTVFNEAFLLRRLEHPSVVQLLETLEDEESYYLVLRYFPGGNLLDYIERYGKIAEGRFLIIYSFLIFFFFFISLSFFPCTQCRIKPF